MGNCKNFDVYQGEWRTLGEIARLTGISSGTLWKRYNRGLRGQKLIEGDPQKSHHLRIREAFKNARSSGIIVDTPRSFGSHGKSYPFNKLEVGQYFLVCHKYLATLKSGDLSVRNAVSQRKEYYNEDYVTTKTKHGLRVLRTR